MSQDQAGAMGHHSNSTTPMHSLEEHRRFFCAFVRGGEPYAHMHTGAAGGAHSNASTASYASSSAAISSVDDNLRAATRLLHASIMYMHVLQNAWAQKRGELQALEGDIPADLHIDAENDVTGLVMPPPFSTTHLSPDPDIAHKQKKLDYILNLLVVSRRNEDRIIERIAYLQDLLDTRLPSDVNTAPQHADGPQVPVVGQQTPPSPVADVPPPDANAPSQAAAAQIHSNLAQGPAVGQQSPASSIAQVLSSDADEQVQANGPHGPVVPVRQHSPYHSPAASAIAPRNGTRASSDTWESANSEDPDLLSFDTSESENDSEAAPVPAPDADTSHRPPSQSGSARSFDPDELMNMPSLFDEQGAARWHRPSD